MACLLDFGSVVRVSDQLTITHVFKVWQAFLAFVDYRSTILSLRPDQARFQIREAGLYPNGVSFMQYQHWGLSKNP
jgi:hypothetical protein